MNEKITKMLGLRPSERLLRSLKAQNLIYNYSIEYDGMIKVQPCFPAKWIEKMPEWNEWVEREIK